MRRTLCLLFLCSAALGRTAPAAAQDRPPDVFADALARMGIAASDLGYRPKGHWARYPQPSTIPHLLPFFDDLLANPLDTYEFTRTLGNVAEELVTPEQLATATDRPDVLYRIGVAFAMDRRIGAFRGFAGSANLHPRPEPERPLYHALVRLLDVSGTPLVENGSFGNAYDEGEDPFAKLRAEVDAVPEPLRLPLARLVLNLIDARRWIDVGLRNVPPDLREKVFATLPRLAGSTGDGTEYFPEIDDAKAALDEPSLGYGALKAMQATQDARREIEAVRAGVASDFEFRLATGYGTVLVSGEEVPRVDDPFLVVGLAGAAPGPLGTTAADRPLSVALLFGDGPLGETDATAALASGILGCGIAYAAGEHRNVWRTGHFGLGAGLLGVGLLVDEGGDDRYEMRSVGQGCGFLGAGLLLDAAGDDEYVLREGDGMGLGFPGGIGILADRAGDDSYFSEPDAAKAGRGDYHSEGAVAVSNAMGVGSGRRGDGSDGHNWAGGLGALLDVDGNDRYEAGNFSLGLGYWYGTGLLWDGGGDDEYVSVYFTQGSGAHFAVGALIDEGGNDRHFLRKNAGAAYGFGWDVVNAFLIDRGDGNDRYLGKVISTGLAEVRSNAFFLDEGGDDIYMLDEGQRGFGDVDERDSYAKPGPASTYPFHLAQVGIFLDLGGEDFYLRRNRDGVGFREDGEAADEGIWNRKAADPASRAGPNVSIGMDVAAGRLGFLDPWPRRTEGRSE